MRVLNAHERELARPVGAVFADLVALGTAQDRIWPEPKMPFRRTGGPMRVGVTRESHGAIRAVLAAFTPDERIVWRTRQRFIDGTHCFEVQALGPNSTRVRHVVDAKLAWWFAPIWTLVVGGLHDRILEGLMDRLGAVESSVRERA